MTTQRQIEEVPASPFHQGDRIRKARELAGYGTNRKTEFADLIEVNRGTLAKYEETGEKIKRSVLISIAWHTPVTLEWLETGDGPVYGPQSPNPGTKKAPGRGGPGASLPDLDSNQEPAG